MSTRDYWNQKILKWESARYSATGLLNPASWSVRSRFQTSVNFLRLQLKNYTTPRLLELGCGSGYLALQLQDIATLHYQGFDISDHAIERARTLFSDKRFAFSVQDFENAGPLPACDIAVLLGVTDWISDAAFKQILEALPAQCALISYTEEKQSAKSLIYRAYRMLKDRNPNQTKTFTKQEFHEIFTRHGWRLERDLSKWTMSPGRLLWLKRTPST